MNSTGNHEAAACLSLVRIFKDSSVRIGLDAESQGKYLAGEALAETDPRPCETALRDGPVFSWVRRALERIESKIRIATTDLRYRESLRAAQKILEEVIE